MPNVYSGLAMRDYRYSTRDPLPFLFRCFQFPFRVLQVAFHIWNKRLGVSQTVSGLVRVLVKAEVICVDLGE